MAKKQAKSLSKRNLEPLKAPEKEKKAIASAKRIGKVDVEHGETNCQTPDAIAYIARLTRGSMIEVLHSNYIRTARAKGLPERVVILRHALKPALLPVISYMGPATAAMISTMSLRRPDSRSSPRMFCRI